MKKSILVIVGMVFLTSSGACVNARAPEHIYIGGSGPAAQDVDSSRVPATRTHEEARAELVKAYDQIRYLEHENDSLRRKYEDAKADKEEYKRKYKRLEDRYDD